MSVPALSFVAAVGATSAAQSVTLSNTGSSDLPVTTITLSDPALRITGGTCAAGITLLVGTSCTVTVAFAPVAAGTAAASLVITTGTSSTPLVVSLSGTASAATGPSLVTSVTAPTYPAGSAEKGAWDLLMAQRLTCGFGLVQQDTRITAAATSHAVYLAQNSIDRLQLVTGPTEDSTWNYFSGVTASDRSAAAGFAAGSSISEILANVFQVYDASLTPSTQPTEALGAFAMRILLESIYQGRGAFTASRTGAAGAALRTGPSATAGFNQQQFRLVVDFAAAADPQRIGLGNVSTWPCAGVGGISGVYAPTAESPRAFADVTDASIRYGTPIYFKADAGSTLVATSATLTKVSDSSSVTLRQLTQANDPNGQLGANELFLVPTSALAPSSSYTLSAAGTVNGTAFTKTFTFSTGP